MHLRAWLVVGIVVTSVSGALAQTGDPDAPRVIPYEGHLEQDGTAVNAVVGFNFALFGCATPDSGCATPLWVAYGTWQPGPGSWTTRWPTSGGSLEAAVYSGTFTTLLGDTEAGMNPLTPAIFSGDGDLYLAIQVEGTALTGLQQIAPAPRAVAGYEARDFDVSGVLTVAELVAETAHVTDGLSVDAGLLPPRMTTAERLALTPQNGLQVFDTEAGVPLYYSSDAARWIEPGAPPIGTISAWHRDLEGVPDLPWGWVACAGQVLDDSESPLDGETIPDLNSQVYHGGRGRYLRGGTSSGLLNDSTAYTDNGLPYSGNGGGPYYGACYGAYDEAEQGDVSSYSTIPGVNARVQVTAMTVVWIMRVK